MQFFSKTHIDFVSVKKQLAIFSITLTVLALLAIVILKPVLGIDFKGGSEIAVQISGNQSIGSVRNVISEANLKGAEIKSFGDADQFLIRVLEENGSDLVQKALADGFPSQKIVMLKVDKIGPKVGSELLIDAVWAILISIVAILLYIAFRFEFNFGVGAIVALVHDVIITFGLLVITHHLGLVDLELNQAILAGMLTVIGYSINDTVIIFDRVRENKEKHKGMNFGKVVNISLNETLPRTMNTVGTTVLVLVVLFIFGGPVLQGFAFCMFWGIVFGTYSSVYVASNFVIWRYEQIEKNNASTSKTGKKLATAKA
jgi:preprotein translocase SecF subunit